MMRLLLLVVLALALGGGAAWYLSADSGYVMLSYGGWVLETSLFGAATAIAVLLFAVYAVFQLLLTGVGLPARVRQALERRRSDLARDSFEAGLLRMLEGRWRQAEIELVRRAADHHAAHLNYLYAARAAQRLEAPERREHYLQLADRGDAESRFATLLSRAELARERGEHAAARDTALELRERELRHPYVLEVLAECYAALQDWDSLHTLLREPNVISALPSQPYQRLLRLALRQRMSAAVAAASLEQARQVWESAPREHREDPLFLRHYAEALARLNADAEAVALISTQLDRDWDGPLISLYGRLHATDALSQLAAVEQWLSRYGERPELMLAAGRVCLRNKLWGKARSYLEAVLRLQPSAEVYLELARVCEATQNKAEAEKFYRQGLEFVAGL